MWDRALRQQLVEGHLAVHHPGQPVLEFGQAGPAIDWHIRNPGIWRRLLRDPALELGETYMAGDWEAPDLASLLETLMRNFPEEAPAGWLARGLRWWRQRNEAQVARMRVARHYDLDEQLFRRFLDGEMHYSCAYFREPNLSLEEAQRAKCEHLAAKLRLAPGLKVLDVGCGWGSLALYLARHHGVDVTGITLSVEQQRVAQERVREAGLQDRVRVLLEDYRAHRGRYDRVVSVGMFEHVGLPQYRTFYRKVRELLGPRGIALIHHIGRPGTPGETNAWIRRYIFPGGYNPSLSEVMAPIEASGLWTTDIEVWRLHYRHTLREWSRRFARARHEVAALKGERFARMWEFYLAACEAAFAVGDLVVFQIQLATDLHTVPPTRDYLYGAQPTPAGGG